MVHCFLHYFNFNGFQAAGTLMIIFLAISLIIGTIWTPKTRGKSLDEITKERYGDEEK